jgi:hypothetical protein
VRDYLPELLGQHMAKFPSIDDLRAPLADPEIEVLPVPRDCTDGFMVALWARLASPQIPLSSQAGICSAPGETPPVAGANARR